MNGDVVLDRSSTLLTSIFEKRSLKERPLLHFKDSVESLTDRFEECAELFGILLAVGGFERS